MPREASRGRLHRQVWRAGHGPGHDHHERAGDEKGDHDPDAALGALEMIEQHRQHQQLRRREYRVEPRSPRRVRPERADQRQGEEGNRHRGDRIAAASAGRHAGRETEAQAISIATTKIAVSEVENGSTIAVRIANTSTAAIQDAGSRSSLTERGEGRVPGDVGHATSPARGSPVRSCCGLAGCRPASPRRHRPRRSRGRRPVSRV